MLVYKNFHTLLSTTVYNQSMEQLGGRESRVPQIVITATQICLAASINKH